MLSVGVGRQLRGSVGSVNRGPVAHVGIRGRRLRSRRPLLSALPASRQALTDSRRTVETGAIENEAALSVRRAFGTSVARVASGVRPRFAARAPAFRSRAKVAAIRNPLPIRRRRASALPQYK